LIAAVCRLAEVILPRSAVDSISPAFEHTKQQLFRPFGFGQWTRLALVGLFAGELSSGGGCSFNLPSHLGATHRDFAFAARADWALWGPLLAASLIAIPLIWLALIYINSRMRFVLFDSVMTKRCEPARMWGRRSEPAFELFLWQIVFELVMVAGFAGLVGVPALIAFLLGWFSPPRSHLAPLILTGVVVFLVVAAWMLAALAVHVFTKDFVVPQMALENISAFEGWRRLWRMLQSEKSSYAGYGGMKLVMAIGAAFAVGALALIAIVLLLIPFGGLGAIAIVAGKVSGLSWNVFTITAAIVAGSIFILCVLYVVSLISVPVIVFFPAYSIYFFAARYGPLQQLLYPPTPPAAPPPPLAPEPIG
jgi:hypothetical protein